MRLLKFFQRKTVFNRESVLQKGAKAQASGAEESGKAGIFNKSAKIKKSGERRKFPLHPSFLLLAAWFICMRQFKEFAMFVGVVLTHELGHYIVARRLGYKLDSFFLAPYGVSLNYKEKAFDSADEVKIALAGPAVNFILAFLCVGLWWLFPETYSATQPFVLQSTMLALFNLLPAYPLDGGRIFVSALGLERKKAVKIAICANVVLSILFFGLFVTSCFINFNPTFALAACFMICGIIQSRFETRYEPVNLFKKRVKDFSRPAMRVIKGDIPLGKILKHLQQNKFTLFVVAGEKTRIIDEKTILSWSLHFPLDLTINEIIVLTSKVNP